MSRVAIVGLLVWAVAAGCKGGEKAEASAAAVEDSRQLAEQEEEMLARRDALVRERQRIRDERTRLAQERERVVAQGGDTAPIDEKAVALLDDENRLLEQEEQLDARYREILRQRREWVDALSSRNDEAARVAAREARIAEREKDVGLREKRIADREAALADRERALARREAETCGAAQPTTIIQTVDAKGSRYTKKDVEPLLKKARSEMSKKGILQSDLPEPARELEEEATEAMKEGDYGRARFAAAQLVATVRSIKVDRAFIAAKIKRLNEVIKGKTLGATAQKEVDALFREATADYGDGKFSSANRKLNRIFAIVD